MQDQQWINEFPGAIIVCDTEGIIFSMNNKAIKTFESDSGENLIGTNVLDCHPEPSKTTLKELFRTQKKNIYTIEKNGVKKLIYQAPWYRNGEYAGFVELSLEIPFEMPHFVRR